MAQKKLADLPEKTRLLESDWLYVEDSTPGLVADQVSKKMEAIHLTPYVFRKTYSAPSITQVRESGDVAITRSGRPPLLSFTTTDANNSVSFALVDSWTASHSPVTGAIRCDVLGGFSVLTREDAEITMDLILQKSADGSQTFDNIIETSSRFYNSENAYQTGDPTITPNKDASNARYFSRAFGRFSKLGNISPSNTDIVGLEVALTRSGTDDVILYGSQAFLNTVTKVKVAGVKSSAVHENTQAFGSTGLYEKTFSFTQDYDVSGSSFEFNYDTASKEDVLNQSITEHRAEISGGLLSFLLPVTNTLPFNEGDVLRFLLRVSSYNPRPSLGDALVPKGKSIEIQFSSFFIDFYQLK